MPAPKLSYNRLPEDEISELLRKKFTPSFRKGYIEVQGHTMPQYFQEFGDRILDLEIKNDDVFVCSFPKCGTTWTQEMVWCIANDLDFEKAREILLPERFPFLEHTVLFDYRDLMKTKLDATIPDFVLDSVKYVSEIPGQRFIKTHLPFNLLPMDLQKGKTEAKIIYVTRDPRDCLVSYYHHCRFLEGFTGNLEEFIQLFLSGNVCFGPYWKHVLEYWKLRSRPNVLFITYEEMKSDLRKVIETVSRFLGKDLDYRQIEELQEHLDFNNMKTNKAVNYEFAQDFNKKYDLITEEGTFMRSGKIGGYREVLSKEQIEVIKKWSKEHSKDSDHLLLRH